MGNCCPNKVAAQEELNKGAAQEELKSAHSAAELQAFIEKYADTPGLEAEISRAEWIIKGATIRINCNLVVGGVLESSYEIQVLQRITVAQAKKVIVQESHLEHKAFLAIEACALKMHDYVFSEDQTCEEVFFFTM